MDLEHKWISANGKTNCTMEYVAIETAARGEGVRLLVEKGRMGCWLDSEARICQLS